MTYDLSRTTYDSQFFIPFAGIIIPFTGIIIPVYTPLYLTTKHITSAHSAFHAHPIKIINRIPAFSKIIPPKGTNEPIDDQCESVQKMRK
ncbi:MAG: hypothetical protein K0Q79_3296 [Flavipsychrobacter sp.]|jgi:hypothetical protein|nr:hypothetical protein [Flavipsychrobacter sp.]